MTRLKDLMDLRGRRGLVTGATGHLGRAIASTLAELGADLLLVDRPAADLAGMQGELADRWATRSVAFECDLEDGPARERLIGQILADGEGLSVLVNNAAFVGTSDLEGWVVPFEQQSLQTWNRALEVNLTAAFHLCQGLIPLLRTSAGASVVQIGSMYGWLGPDWSLYEGTHMGNPAAYSASKGALIQLTRWMATTAGPDVRFNVISPGGISRNQPVAFAERYQRRTPLGRMATEDDFRGAIAYLATDMSAYVTGQNLKVDGGWGVW